MSKKTDVNKPIDATETKSRGFFVELARRTKMKTALIFVAGMVVMFIIKVAYDVAGKYVAYDPDSKTKSELASREIIIDENVMFQSNATQKISDLEESTKKIDKKVSDLLKAQDATLEKINGTLKNLQDGTKAFKDDVNKTIAEEIKKGTRDLSKAIDEQKKQTTDLATSLGTTNSQIEELRKYNATLENKLAELEKKREEDAKNQKIISVPTDDQKSLVHPKDLGGAKEQAKKKEKKEKKNELSDNPTIISGSNENYNPDSYGIQIVMNENTMSYSGDDNSLSGHNTKKQAQKKKQDDFTVPVGVAEGILFTGGEAKISGFGDTEDENTPVGIKLLSDMTIANGNYKQVEDCFLIGSAKGELGSNRAIIRLYKISCLFQDEKSDLYIAEGNVKGWVYDENSSLGVSGRLISKEGQIIMTSLPLTLLQAGMDYLTKSATNINILGSADVSSALSSGLSNGANQSFEKLQKIYEKYLDALTPAISFRAGRKISILFEGGQTIPLRLFKKNKDAQSQGLRNAVDFMLQDNDRVLMEQVNEE